MDSVTIDCIFSTVKIEPNSRNDGNNSDSWEITITTEQAMYVNGQETRELIFTVTGGCELDAIADALSRAVKAAR